MVIIESTLLALLSAVALVSVGFVVAFSYRRRYDLIDSIWGLLFIAIAWESVIVYAPWNGFAVMIAVLVTIWGLRLSRHIFVRWLHSPSEDRRYAELRSTWPKRGIDVQVFARIYLTQAVLATIISLPVTLFVISNPGYDIFVAVGALVWGTGLVVEAIADRQLRTFLADERHKEKLMTGGLWRYSRHPNYFGEMLVWWGIGIMGIGQSYGLAGLIGPAVISVLLGFVSGVPLAEKSMMNKPGWQAYKTRTSVLIPWRIKS